VPWTAGASRETHAPVALCPGRLALGGRGWRSSGVWPVSPGWPAPACSLALQRRQGVQTRRPLPQNMVRAVLLSRWPESRCLSVAPAPWPGGWPRPGWFTVKSRCPARLVGVPALARRISAIGLSRRPGGSAGMSAWSPRSSGHRKRRSVARLQHQRPGREKALCHYLCHFRILHVALRLGLRKVAFRL
jgi:hypothetical protein